MSRFFLQLRTLYSHFPFGQTMYNLINPRERLNFVHLTSEAPFLRPNLVDLLSILVFGLIYYSSPFFLNKYCVILELCDFC